MLVVLLGGLALADPAGDALGQKVAAAAGDVSALSRLRFSFVVDAAGTEKLRRSFDWHPQGGQLTVVGPDGTTIALDGVNDHDMMAAALDPAAAREVWAEVCPGVAPEAAAKAWAWFVNDSYWLLAPAKVMDPGVTRTVDEQGRLVLAFDGVGLTPGDRYKLRIDPETHWVTGWDFVLEGGRKGSFAFTDHQALGPLQLPTRRSTDDGAFVIRFEDVVAE